MPTRFQWWRDQVQRRWLFAILAVFVMATITTFVVSELLLRGTECSVISTTAPVIYRNSLPPVF